MRNSTILFARRLTPRKCRLCSPQEGVWKDYRNAEGLLINAAYWSTCLLFCFTCCMFYVWKSSIWIGIHLYFKELQKTKATMTDKMQSWSSCSVNYYRIPDSTSKYFPDSIQNPDSLRCGEQWENNTDTILYEVCTVTLMAVSFQCIFIMAQKAHIGFIEV